MSQIIPTIHPRENTQETSDCFRFLFVLLIDSPAGLVGAENSRGRSAVELQVRRRVKRHLIYDRAINCYCETDFSLFLSTNQRAFRGTRRQCRDRYAPSHTRGLSFTYTRTILLVTFAQDDAVSVCRFGTRDGRTGRGINCNDRVLIDNEGH